MKQKKEFDLSHHGDEFILTEEKDGWRCAVKITTGRDEFRHIVLHAPSQTQMMNMIKILLAMSGERS